MRALGAEIRPVCTCVLVLGACMYVSVHMCLAAGTYAFMYACVIYVIVQT